MTKSSFVRAATADDPMNAADFDSADRRDRKAQRR
jgi:hypothetical protein